MLLGGELQKAIDNDDVAAIHAAIAAGDDVSKTAVNHAATSEKLKALAALLELLDEISPNAMILSAQNGRFESLRCLVENGVDPDLSNKVGATAMTYATLENRPRFIEYLLDAGADVDRRDAQDRTAVDIAIKYQSKDAAQVLLDRGATLTDEQASALARMGLEVDAEPAPDDTSRRANIIGRWSLDQIRYEGDFAEAGFIHDSDTMSAEDLKIEDNFIAFDDDGCASGKYFGSEFSAEWTIDGDRITVTRKLREPVTYRLDDDASSLLRMDYDEEHGLDMYVTYSRSHGS